MIRLGVGIVILGLLFFIALTVIVGWESSILENQVNISPIAGTRQQDWLNVFQDTAFYQLMTAVLCTMAWLIWGAIRYRVKSWKTAGGRLAWAIIGVFMLFTVAIIGWLYTAPTQGDNGKLYAVIFYILNALLIYYLTTVLSSPTPVKYAPVGAITANRVTGGSY